MFTVSAAGSLTFLSVLLSFTIQLLPIRWGICAPKQCSEEDVTNALQDIFTGTVSLFCVAVKLFQCN